MKCTNISKNIIIVVLLAALLSGNVLAASDNHQESSVSANGVVEQESLDPDNTTTEQPDLLPANAVSGNSTSKDTVASDSATSDSATSNSVSNNSVSSNTIATEADGIADAPFSESVVSFEKYAASGIVEDDGTILPYYTDSLIAAYQRNNPKYQKIAIEKKLIQGQYQEYDKKLQTLEKQLELIINMIDTTEKQKEQYEKDGNAIGVLNAIASIENYRSQFYEQLKNYAQAGLLKDTAAYKAVRGDKTADEQQRTLVFEFYRQYQMIPLYHKQIECLKAEVDELEKTKSVEELKLKTGYSISITVAQVQTTLALKKAEYHNAVADLEYKEAALKANCGNADIKAIDIPPISGIENEDYYKKLFMESNITYPYLHTLLKSYDRYVVYAEKNKIETEVEQAQKSLMQLDIDQYCNIDLPIYIRQFINSYRNIQEESEAIKVELQTNKEKQRVMELLISKGQATPLDLLKIKSEQKRIELKNEKLKYDASLIKFVLENRVENQVVGDSNL